MTTEATVSLEERLRSLFHHLGIDQAHFACRLAQDWVGLAARYPEMIVSLTVLGGSFDPRAVEQLAAKLLVVIGDQEPNAKAVSDSVNRLPGAQLVTFRDYEGYTNQNKHQMLVEQIQQGKFVTVWPVELQTGKPIWPFPGWK